MKIHELHSWNMTPKEAISLQRELAEDIEIVPFGGKATYVAGADVSYSKKDPRIYAAVLVLKLPELETVESAVACGIASFPYIPGLLSFREIPILIRAFKMLKNIPDLVLCDGQGIAHPRGIGLASHLGLFLQVPTIGCAKSRLVGHFRPVREKRWSKSALKDDGKTIGAVLRTKAGVKPLFISPGHLIDLKGSVVHVKKCMGSYRLPEPTRRAHIEVNRLRMEFKENAKNKENRL